MFLYICTYTLYIFDQNLYSNNSTQKIEYIYKYINSNFFFLDSKSQKSTKATNASSEIKGIFLK